jgi:hypothetical protein
MTRTEGEVKKNGLAVPWYGAGKAAAIEKLWALAQRLSRWNFLLLRGEKERDYSLYARSRYCGNIELCGNACAIGFTRYMKKFKSTRFGGFSFSLWL